MREKTEEVETLVIRRIMFERISLSQLLASPDKIAGYRMG